MYYTLCVVHMYNFYNAELKSKAILKELVVTVMEDLEKAGDDEGDDGSDEESSEDDTMQFVTAHTSIQAMSPNITSSGSDTGTMIEHGDNTMVEDMGMGTLVIQDDDDDTMKSEYLCHVTC